jgi:hypothetical protein
MQMKANQLKKLDGVAAANPLNIRTSMPLRKIISTFVLLNLGSVLGAFQTDDGYHSVAFTKVGVVEVAKLREGEVKDADFHGFHLASDWVQVDRVSGVGLGGLLQRSVGYIIASRNKGELIDQALCFDPGYAVRVHTGDGIRDFAICLTCAQLYAYDQKGHSLGFHFGEKTLAEFSGYYTEEFGANVARKK